MRVYVFVCEGGHQHLTGLHFTKMLQTHWVVKAHMRLLNRPLTTLIEDHVLIITSICIYEYCSCYFFLLNMVLKKGHRKLKWHMQKQELLAGSAISPGIPCSSYMQLWILHIRVTNCGTAKRDLSRVNGNTLSPKRDFSVHTNNTPHHRLQQKCYRRRIEDAHADKHASRAQNSDCL